jgi:succinoglycan biosynthesis protein ExoO
VIYYDAAAQRVSRLGIEPARIGACLELDRYTFVRHCMMNQPGCIDLAGLKPIMRRSFLMSHGLLYPEDSRHGEDFIFYFRAIMAGAKFSLFPEPGYLYSERFGTISRQRSDMSRTTVDYRLMERRALELASDATVRNDPMLASLLVARAGRIRALYRARELRASLKSRDLLDLALQFVRHADARAFLSNAVRRKLMRPTHRMR